MAKSSNQKLKILVVRELLESRTDEQHPMTLEEISRELAMRGIPAERKSLYDDIETLQTFGLDVHVLRGRKSGYYVGERKFELPEIKLLIDSVQSSKFITEKKTIALIKKLAGLMSVYEGQLIKRQVFVKNRIKSMNESIYYNVDCIHSAIAEDKQIEFRYYAYTITKEKKFRRNGKPYKASPLALSWADENYYLIAYEGESGIIKHFRVDKMDDITILEQPREGSELMKSMDMAAYTRRNFSMFGGEEKLLTLRFANHLMGVVIDTFGKDVAVTALDKERFMIRTRVAVSPQFFGWLCGLDGEAAIVSPPLAAEAFARQLKRVYEGQQEDKANSCSIMNEP